MSVAEAKWKDMETVSSVPYQSYQYHTNVRDIEIIEIAIR